MKKLLLRILLCTLVMLFASAACASADLLMITLSTESKAELDWENTLIICTDSEKTYAIPSGSPAVVSISKDTVFEITATDVNGVSYSHRFDYVFKNTGLVSLPIVLAASGGVVPPPEEVTAKVRLMHEGQPLAGVRFSLLYLEDGDSVSATTDEDGYATFTLTKEGAYFVNMGANGYLIPADKQVEFTLDELKAGVTVHVSKKEENKPIEGVKLIQNVYLLGEDGYRPFRSSGAQNFPVKQSTQHSFGSGVSCEGLTRCTDVKITMDGEEIPFTWDDGSDSDGNPTVTINGNNVKANSTITADFYYEYTDGETQYELTVNHVFIKPHTADEPLVIERETPLRLHAGEAFEVFAQTSKDNLRIKKTGDEFAGCHSGTWSLRLVIVEGGDHGGLIGGFEALEQGTETYAVRDRMIHSDADVNFLYHYNEVMIPVSVMIVWEDDNDADGIRPDEITLYLYADGEPVEGGAVTLSPENNWTVTLEGLPTYDNDRLINYSFHDSPVAGYSTTYAGDAEDCYVITHVHLRPQSMPETGDSAAPAAWLAIACASMAAALCLGRKRGARRM